MSRHSNGGCLFSSYSMGAVLAFIISYAMNHSLLHAFVHGCFSWLYVIYALLEREVEILPALGHLFHQLKHFILS